MSTVYEQRRALWLPEATRLRAKGFRFADIGKRLGGVNPMTVSCYMPRDLQHLSTQDLAELRKAAVPPEAVARYVAERQEERWALAEERRLRRRYRWSRGSQPLRRVVSLDYDPPGNLALQERISSGDQDDPYMIVSGELDYGHILGDLQIEDIEGLNEWELERLRARLIEAGVRRGLVPAAERERWNPKPKKVRRPVSRRRDIRSTIEALGGQDLISRAEMEERGRRPWETRSRGLRRKRRRWQEEQRLDEEVAA